MTCRAELLSQTAVVYGKFNGDDFDLYFINLTMMHNVHFVYNQFNFWITNKTIIFMDDIYHQTISDLFELGLISSHSELLPIQSISFSSV